MNYQWRNDRKPDENGDYVLDILTSAGKRVSTFKAPSMEDMVDQLAEAQVLSSRKLGRMLNPDRGRKEPFHPQPKSLTAEDRERLAMDITDPAKVAEVVSEIVERTTGATPTRIVAELSERDRREKEEFEIAETDAFLKDYPDYFPAPENQQAIYAELNLRGYGLTRNNLAIAYEHLLNEGKLKMWPGDIPPQEPPESTGTPTPQGAATPEPQGQPRPLRSTGLRSSDGNASRPAPRPKKPLVTKRDLAFMGKRELNERLRDPAFRQAVDELGVN
jgi:hypothetical protein